MIGLVLVTHGRLATEFAAAMEHIVGPQTQLETVCIGPEDDMEVRRADIEAANDPKAELLKIEARLNALRSPFRSAEKFWVEEIIDPRSTRQHLVDFMHLAEPLRTPGKTSFPMRP